MQVFTEDTNQINQAYLLENNTTKLLFFRIIFTILSALPWWTQFYEYSKFEIWRVLTNWEFLTYWGVWSIHLYFILALVDTIYYRKYGKEYESKIWKLTHFLFHFGFSTSLAISIMFWVSYYPDLPDNQKYNVWFMFCQILQHVLLFLCIATEFMYNNIRFAWVHLKLVMLALVSYMIVNLIVTFAYKPVYDSIDWVSVMCYVYIVCVFVLVILYFAFAKYLYEKYKLPKINIQNAKTDSPTIFPQAIENQVLEKI
ncbi:transmembrane protein, putative (macronuclear) [Tetrahymena thermophila SB210]|uniref:Transmembrane protein, putative n=1 Tax=Tetrahymena thermophila (strain SB210) TaxID=312017 RepID=I7MIH4_TETTS|nr:transmembrane protein, putative [Tetrahymena thermophila SB210]EAS04436.2 transmembrane protein, putative [Tetrahymena thermophila SB210]|eukprot:XP_001024681.2 transmembrane protein, putative [Tetrahymena thermophila SB210]